MVTEEQILEALSQVLDPELNFDVVALGLIYSIDIQDGKRVFVKMTLTTPACPLAGQIHRQAEAAVASVPGITQAMVELVYDPPWNPTMMSDEAKLSLGYPI